MSTEVFANGCGVACKAGAGKVLAAFPDVCMSPPPPPAGPVPVPYPNTSFDADMRNGSKTVKIGGKEVMLKDVSYYATSPLGNEAATRNFGAGVMTHVITGKTYFVAWSMDVKIEGQNVDRHEDLTTSNHASPGGNSAPQLNFSQRSLDRIAYLKCPCCGRGRGACAGAFAEDDEPITFNQFFGIGERGNEGRTTALAEMMKEKAESCTCNGEVFPTAPCNVFRRNKPSRTRAIEAQWDERGRKQDYADRFRAENPQAIREFRRNSLAGVVRWAKTLQALPDGHPDRARYLTDAKRVPNQSGPFGKTNHLVPKAAGGCPDNPANLQPMDLLCAVCRKIDMDMGAWIG
jgi:hypothetical protein